MITLDSDSGRRYRCLWLKTRYWVRRGEYLAASGVSTQ